MFCARRRDSKKGLYHPEKGLFVHLEMSEDQQFANIILEAFKSRDKDFRRKKSWARLLELRFGWNWKDFFSGMMKLWARNWVEAGNLRSREVRLCQMSFLLLAKKSKHLAPSRPKPAKRQHVPPITSNIKSYKPPGFSRVSVFSLNSLFPALF